MKIPVFHKFYTINFLIYLNFLNLILVLINPYECLSFFFKVPLENLGLYCNVIYYYNIFVVPIFVLGVFVEVILRRFLLIKSEPFINTNKIVRNFVFLIFGIGFIISIFLGLICVYSQIPYTPQELEQIRFD